MSHDTSQDPPRSVDARHLVQLLLPLYDNDGEPTPADRFREVREELTARFGGLTTYTRAPADGVWKEDATHVSRDRLVIYEVMTDRLDAAWWAEYRKGLEHRFRQESLVVRAHAISLM